MLLIYYSFSKIATVFLQHTVQCMLRNCTLDVVGLLYNLLQYVVGLSAHVTGRGHANHAYHATPGGPLFFLLFRPSKMRG